KFNYVTMRAIAVTEEGRLDERRSRSRSGTFASAVGPREKASVLSGARAGAWSITGGVKTDPQRPRQGVAPGPLCRRPSTAAEGPGEAEGNQRSLRAGALGRVSHSQTHPTRPGFTAGRST